MGSEAVGICVQKLFSINVWCIRNEQGMDKSDPAAVNYAEAVWVFFDPTNVKMEDYLLILLHTHSCTANYSMRVKYLSAIYIFIPLQKKDANNSLKFLHLEFELENITQVLSFVDFTSIFRSL